MTVFRDEPGNQTYTGTANAYDQVDYEGALSDYTITRNDDGSVTVTHPNLDTDTLYNIDGFWFFNEAAWYSIDDAIALTNGGSNPVVEGTDFNDALYGSDLNNTFIGSAGDDTINGNGGDYNQVDYAGAITDYTFDLNEDGTVTASHTSFGIDTLTDIDGFWFQGEQAWYSLENALEIAPPKTSNRIEGTDGIDILRGTDGDDAIFGFEGNDVLFGGEGNDTLYGGTGNDTLRGEASNDSLFGGNGDDSLGGGTGDDVLTGGAGEDLLTGNDGNDRLFGGDDDDLLLGGDGDDFLDGGAGNDFISGGLGNDTLISGGAFGGNDVLVGDGGGGRPNGPSGPLDEVLDADTFVLLDTAEGVISHDVIVDFQQGIDVLDISRLEGVSSFEDLNITINENGNVAIYISEHHSVVFENQTDIAAFDAADFLL